MQPKHKFFYMVTGAVLGVTILLIGMAVSPTTAQRDAFGEITCTGLRVLNQNGTSAVKLTSSERGGVVSVWGKDGKKDAMMGGMEPGGPFTGLRGEYVAVVVFDNEGAPVALMGSGGGAGAIDILNKDRMPVAGMSSDEGGGVVSVSGKDGEIAASMFTSHERGGIVNVWDRNGRSKADMRVGKHGGLVSTYSNDGEGRSAMGVNQYGSGAVSTWDKYGDKSGDMIGKAVSPTTAQRDTLREIICTGLTVVNPDGTTGVKLMVGKHGGLVGVYGKDGKSMAGVGIDEHGGKSFAGKSLKSVVGMNINELSGASFAGVLTGTTEFGGDVTVKGIDGKRKAAMGIFGHGAGAVEVRDKDGMRKAVMYINQYGTGDVGTFDKNGYRQ